MTRLIVLAATLLVIGVNVAANIVPINGFKTGQLSALYPTGFTPAGWVFAIWGVIYSGLLIFSIYSLCADETKSSRLDRVRVPFLASCAANAAWIFFWHYRQILASLVVMFVLLGSLVIAYVRLRRSPAQSWQERLCMDLTFSIYLGWISTAAIANFGAWCFDIGAYPFGLRMDDWALVSVTFATAIYVGVGTLTRDPIFVAVFAWASLGIVYQKLPVSVPVRVVAATACAVVTLLVLALCVDWLRGPGRRLGPNERGFKGTIATADATASGHGAGLRGSAGHWRIAFGSRAGAGAI